MNQLSWLLYIGGVSENVGLLLGFLGLCALFVLAFIVISDTIKEDDGSLHITWRAMVTSITVVLFWLTASLVPSKDVIYAIAASEMGEQVLKSSTVNKAILALDHWLDEQITK